MRLTSALAVVFVLGCILLILGCGKSEPIPPGPTPEQAEDVGSGPGNDFIMLFKWKNGPVSIESELRIRDGKISQGEQPCSTEEFAREYELSQEDTQWLIKVLAEWSELSERQQEEAAGRIRTLMAPKMERWAKEFNRWFDEKKFDRWLDDQEFTKRMKRRGDKIIIGGAIKWEDVEPDHN